MSQTYPDQFTPWLPNHVAPMDDTDDPICADRLALIYFMTCNDGSTFEQIADIRDLFLSSLLTNGLIDFMIISSENFEDEDIL